MRMLNELAEYPLMKQVRGLDSTDDEQAAPPLLSCAPTSSAPYLLPLGIHTS